jgi:hypothetical protein
VTHYNEIKKFVGQRNVMLETQYNGIASTYTLSQDFRCKHLRTFPCCLKDVTGIQMKKKFNFTSRYSVGGGYKDKSSEKDKYQVFPFKQNLLKSSYNFIQQSCKLLIVNHRVL